MSSVCPSVCLSVNLKQCGIDPVGPGWWHSGSLSLDNSVPWSSHPVRRFESRTSGTQKSSPEGGSTSHQPQRLAMWQLLSRLQLQNWTPRSWTNSPFSTAQSVLSLSVTLCIVALMLSIQGKMYQRASSRQVPICPFRHFCCTMYRLATKRTGKKTSSRKRECECLRHRKPRMHWYMERYLLSRTWEAGHRELCLSRLSGLSLGVFIKSSRFNRIAGLFYTAVCCSYTVRHSQYDRLSQQQLNFLYM